MNFQVVTLFPEMFSAITEYGITGRAVKQGLVELNTTNPRDFAQDRHRTVDDRPFGGGPGMVMMMAPLQSALAEARAQLPQGSPVVYLSPQGQPLNQQRVKELAALPGLVLLAGRYEGVDERLLETEVDMEISVGDYVLSGGEIPAMAVLDAIIRTLPGVLGHEQSASQDSFSGELTGLLDCPHYTRPENYQGMAVPEVLLSGHHERIRRWRLQQSLGRTWLRRPELLQQKQQQGLMSDEEQQLLDAFLQENVDLYKD